jgi:hypothetical protein
MSCPFIYCASSAGAEKTAKGTALKTFPGARPSQAFLLKAKSLF